MTRTRQSCAPPSTSEQIRNVLPSHLALAEPVDGGTIDFQAKSILVEKGGLLQAGSPDCVFGVKGGKLSIGIYGDDPTELGTIESPTDGIRCMTNPSSEQRCFPSDRDPSQHVRASPCRLTGVLTACDDERLRRGGDR